MRKVAAALTFTMALCSCSAWKPAVKETADTQKQNGGLIEMGLEAQKHVGLKVAPTAVNQLTEYLHVTGTVQPVDSKIAQVRALAKGRVQEVLVRVGDRVRSGQPLAVFDSIEAGELVAQYEAARAELQKLKIQQTVALKQMERNKRLAEIGAVPQKDFELSQAEQRGLLEAVKAQESLTAGIAARLRRFGVAETDLQKSSMTTIRSPFAGVLIRAKVAPGEVVDAAAELFSVADLSEVWVQAEVYEKDLGRIRAGQPAFIEVDTYPGQKFIGRVAYISDMLDPTTRTAKVRCELPNPETMLKLDMFASVYLPTTYSRTAIAVPTGAIQQIENKKLVFVRKSGTKFEPRPIQAGRDVDGRTEITTGLREGEMIVVNGAFHLKSILVGGGAGEKE